MTDIKEALFDEEPEKREGSGEKDPDMEPLFGQGSEEPAGEEIKPAEVPEAELQKEEQETSEKSETQNIESASDVDTPSEEPKEPLPEDSPEEASEEPPKKKGFFSRFKRKKENPEPEASEKPDDSRFVRSFQYFWHRTGQQLSETV